MSYGGAILFCWWLFVFWVFISAALKNFRLTKDDLFYGYCLSAIPFSILVCVTADYMNK